MAEQTEAAATAKEIRAALPKATSDFILDCVENGYTLAQSKDQYCGWLEAQVDNRDKQLAERPAAPAGGKRTGMGMAAPVGSGRRGARATAAEQDADAETEYTGDAVADFDAAVCAQMQKPGYKDDRKKAITAVCRRDPELHEQYLLATNGAGVAGKIRDRFGK